MLSQERIQDQAKSINPSEYPKKEGNLHHLLCKASLERARITIFMTTYTFAQWRDFGILSPVEREEIYRLWFIFPIIPYTNALDLDSFTEYNLSQLEKKE